MIKKILTVFLMLSMVFALLAGCGSGQNEEQPSSTAPGTDSTSASGVDGAAAWEPATISVYTWLSYEESWGAKSKGEIKCFEELEKRTNTKVDWSMMSDTNSFELMMSSGETTDVIWYSWAPSRQLKYAKAGLIQDIYPLVKEYAPNIMRLMEENPKLKKQLVTPEGKMYLVPWVTEDPILTRNAGLAIRQDWLDKLGLDAPETADELYDTFKQFRDRDANGSGQPDEIMTGYSDQLYKLMYGFGTADDWHMADDGKTVVFGPTTENYKNALKWFAKLYKEGILDPDYLSRDGDIYTKKVMANQVGLYLDEVFVISQFNMDSAASGTPTDFEPLGYLKYNGKRVSYNSTTKRVAQQYGSVISSKAKDPARIIKWLDYMFGDEGSRLMNWGIEGESYEMKDGKLAYTAAVTNDPQYESSVARSQYAEPTWCGPQSGEAELAMLNDAGKKFRQAWADVDNTNAIEPYMFYTDAEQSAMDEYSTNLKTERDTWRDKFITGEKDIDAEWNNYIEALNNMKLKELIAAQQGAYDRFIGQ